MNKIDSIHPVFVDAIPVDPEFGSVYISLKYKTAVHLCCCGCGSKVVTPLKPGQWSLTTQRGLVSLTPSIGNWSFPCRSHYWIIDSSVRWSDQFTDQQIDEVRARDRRDKERHFEHRRSRGFLQTLWDWIVGLFRS